MDMGKTRMYFVGIKGVGMAGLAIIAKESGFTVSGSDIAEEFLTDAILKKHQIIVDTGFEVDSVASFFSNGIDNAYVITTAAHEGMSNPQVEWALKQSIPVLTHGQAVGKFMEGELLHREFRGISVLGCHGKTTVTAMAAIALKTLKLDPTYTVGTSEIFPGGDAGHLGSSEYFVAEADEYVSDMKFDRTVKFLYQHPEIAIINNIDFDHPDVYKDLEEVKATFLKFCAENIKHNGLLIVNADDINIHHILPSVKEANSDIKIITYGENASSNVKISNYKELGWDSQFDVEYNGVNLGQFSVSVPGYYNAKNSLGVIALLLSIGIEVSDIKPAIAAFKGTKRRQEVLGETKEGSIIIDDYAHHPEEIDKTLTAIKKAYPEKKIVALFQPHTLSRTESLQDEFANAFSASDEVIMLPIFTSKREGEANYEKLYNDLENAMNKIGTNVVFMQDYREKDQLEFSPFFLSSNRAPVIKYIQEHIDAKDCVLVTLGAGDIYKIAYDLIEQFSSKV